MTVAYVTKYALTTGVFTVQGEVSEKMFIQWTDGSSSINQIFHGNDWHLNETDALSRAEEMRIAKLKSLDKQMKKISAMKFDITREGG